MPFIREMIVASLAMDGLAYLVPLGLIKDGESWIAAPFRPSNTLDHLTRHPYFTASVTDDVRIYAGLLTGRRDWACVKADYIDGWRLQEAVSHYEFEVQETFGHVDRPHFRSRVVHEQTHAPSPGFNRAQAAVIEAAILASRLHMLSDDKLRAEMGYLEIAISKTGGPREAEAWSWLKNKIDIHLSRTCS